MAPVIPLPQPAPAAIDQYRRLVAKPIDTHSVLVPLDELPRLQREIEASLRPAQLCEVNMAVAALGASLKIPGTIENPEKFGEAMVIEIAEYPADILKEAIRHARRTLDWFPTIKEMIAICETLIEPRRRQLRAIALMEEAHHRRRQAAAQREIEAERRKTEAEREAEREVKREARRQVKIGRLKNLEVQSRERFGDDAPLPGDIELADSLSATRTYRAGTAVSWQAALATGENWAAKYCRQIALAARVKRALEQGRVSWDGALAAAKLIPTDEADARRYIDDIEGRTAGHPGCQPTESFWRAVWKIARACGLDTPRFPEDAAAAAVENLKHLTALADLADTRGILDEQVLNDWRARRSRSPGITSGVDDDKNCESD